MFLVLSKLYTFKKGFLKYYDTYGKKNLIFWDFLNLLVNTVPKRKLQVICSKNGCFMLHQSFRPFSELGQIRDFFGKFLDIFFCI